MSDQATRQDIDEVIGIMKDFMSQISDQFTVVHERLDKLDTKYDHLINNRRLSFAY